MGAQYSHFFLPNPPSGSVTVVVEAGECCGCEACTGRTWDDSIQKPPFVALSNNEWANFKTQMRGFIKSYRPEGWGFLGFFLLFAGLFLFHPSIGPIGRSMGNFGLAMILMMGSFVGGIILMIVTQVTFRQHNYRIDIQIDDLCRRCSGSDHTFTYQRLFTQACKPKGAHTYRALIISPGPASNIQAVHTPFGGFGGMGVGPAPPTHGSSTMSHAMSAVTQGVPVAAAVPAQTTMVRVTCPATSSAGDTIQIMAPSGQAMMVVVPDGVAAGGQFDVQLPSEAPPVVAAVPVP